jgi:AraC-like DNA-binding protein/CheY-like chemotaxis protein
MDQKKNMGSTPKQRLLWFDCTSGVQESGLRVQCASVFEVVHTSCLERASDDIERLGPTVLSFDFDHPDQSSLHVMQSVKKAHPKLPILMLTLDHSESLAIWAFRARVWNYLVKPISSEEFAENLDALAKIGNRASPPRVAQMLVAAIPDDLPVHPIDSRIAQLQPALHYIKQHYHEKISAIAAAEPCGLTRFEFSRKFRAAFGMTFRDYLLRVRITEARRLLTEGGSSVTKVAYSVGFNDGSHFAHLFKRYTNVLPSEYRANDPPAHRESTESGDVHGPVPRRRASDLRTGDRHRTRGMAVSSNPTDRQRLPPHNGRSPSAGS